MSFPDGPAADLLLAAASARRAGSSALLDVTLPLHYRYINVTGSSALLDAAREEVRVHYERTKRGGALYVLPLRTARQVKVSAWVLPRQNLVHGAQLR